jgi:hypothetical protein
MEWLQGAVGAHQSQAVHAAEIAFATRLTREEIEQEERHHKEMLQFHRRIHRDELKLSQTHTEVQVQLALSLARKDAVRDVFSQRSQSTQTTMVVSALLIGCTFALTYTFVPPKESPPGAVTAFSACLAVSVLLLAGSTFTALQLQARMVRYDLSRPYLRYNCGKTHNTFSSYFDCHCSLLESFSIRLFYLGATVTLTAAALLMFLTFRYSFHNQGAAVTFVVVVGLGVVVLWLLDLLVPSATHLGSTDMTGVGNTNFETFP